MTQEFVTLPREVVEQALDALFMYKPMVTGVTFQHGLEAMQALRAALEQPQNHVPDVGNMVQSGWKLVPVEPTCGMVLAGEHSMKQHDFFRLDAGYRAMLAAAPQHPTTEQSSAVEQPQGEQEPSPTAGMNIAQRILHIGGRNNAAGYVEFGSIQAVEALVLQVLRDLPRQHEPQVEQEPVAWMYEQQAARNERGVGGWDRILLFCKPGSKFTRNITPLYTHPQPKREPLSTARIDELIEEGIFGGNPYELVRRLEEERGVFMTRPLTVEQIDGIINVLDPIFLDTTTGFEEDFCRAIEAAHNIK